MSKLTANQREFEKQIRRINRLIAKVEAEGLVFIKPPIEPIKPKRVTRSKLEELQSTTIRSLRAKSYEVDKTTGEVIPYKKPVGASRTKRPNITGFRSHGTMNINVPLSAEDLHEIRQEAGRKAQQTIKRRMREDPAYARYITEVRKRAGKRANEAMRKRMAEDPEFAKKMRDIWSKNLAKGRAKRGEKEPQDVLPPSIPKPVEPAPSEPKQPRKREPSPEEQKKQEIEDQENAPDYQPANGTDTILDNMIAILSSAINEKTANFLIWLAQHQYSDEQSKIEYAQYLSSRSYWILDLATKIAYYDSTEEQLRDDSATLASFISNNDYSEDELREAIWGDMRKYGYEW